jgi:hypothetical protein
MAKTHLLPAVCTVAMLAAVPALAQTPQTGMTGSASQGGADASAMHNGHPMHHSAMGHSTGAMHGRSDSSQDAAVDRLNEQSYQAAQQGQSFGADAGPGPMSTPGGSSGMNGMSGRSMPSNVSGGAGTKP